MKIIEPNVVLFRENPMKYMTELESLWSPGPYDKIVAVK